MGTRFAYLAALALPVACGGHAASDGPGSASASAPSAPSNAVSVGPYPVVSGGRSTSATQASYELQFGSHGYALFTALGSLQVGRSLRLVSGLVRLPDSAAVSAGWVCPGDGATWNPLRSAGGSSDCTAASCDYQLILPSPSELACPDPAAGGALEFSAAGVGGSNASVTSSVARLNGASLAIRHLSGLSLDREPSGNPTQISYLDPNGGATAQSVDIVFDSQASAPVAAGATGRAWALSNVSVLYNPTGLSGPTELLCASGGTYQVSFGNPALHSLALNGVSAPLSCPGAPLATPLSLEIDD